MRGTCGNCGRRRVLRGGLCSSCIREDNEGQREHEEYLADQDARPIQVTIHGKYGRGPMPVEFRDAMVELVRCVVQGIEDGTLGKKRCPHGHIDCCGHHDLEDMPIHQGDCDAGSL